ncbi:CHAD domain-containing protein [Kitasatospora sp. NPDC057223]|uniref:CYTH and CHAD domain-containing protein n=1 Tax=Kitasatospora sp. NPDC057223 TaxID=3346055 RepID=UPI00362B3788
MASIHQETERSYDGKPGQALDPAGLPQVTDLRTAGAQTLEALYYDTADLRLLAHGRTLRRRTGGDDAGWHLKVPAGAGAEGEHRTEYRLPPGPAGAGPPPELLARTAALARGGRLLPVMRLRTHRERELLLGADGRTLAELTRDDVSAELPEGAAPASGRQALPGPVAWSETEVELAEGGPAELLDAVGARLEDAGLARSAAASKVARALAAHGRAPEHPAPEHLAPGRPGHRSTGPGPAGPQPAPPAGSVGAALTAYLREQVADLLTLDGLVRIDEPDSVHRMRVCARRLRSALTAHRSLLVGARTDPVAEELRLLGQVLGRARDAETTGERLVAQAQSLPLAARPEQTAAELRDWFGHRYAHAHRAAVHVMEGRRYFALLDELEELAERPPLRAKASRGGRRARRILLRERRRTGRRFARALKLPPGPERDAALHGARKAAKRARYTAEVHRASAGRPAKRLGRRAKHVQQALGRRQDARVTEQSLLELVAEVRARGGDTFGYGVLHGLQRADDEADVAEAADAWAGG